MTLIEIEIGTILSKKEKQTIYYKMLIFCSPTSPMNSLGLSTHFISPPLLINIFLCLISHSLTHL